MTEAMATNIWLAAGAYAAIGVVVALILLLGAMKRFDPLGARAPLRVKLLLLPGLAALWPMMLVRFVQGPRG